MIHDMYAWYVDANDFDQGIWTSLDGGNSWIQINDAGIINCGDQAGCGTEQGTYNLELAAVPNGSSGVTDLYAGTINLYKCEITSTSPTCNGAGSNTFLNLTHAYGCSSIAMVHPAQHGVSFLINRSAQDVMYFANDGGIYRALDGYGLQTGTCGGANPFDSLNMTLGSMTQFVSFSQALNDASAILGGTQGNGSAGTQSTGGSWQNVNAGDGGYSQINPNVGVFWSFTASASWQELGPAPNSGQAGYLPNVAVTALGIFTRSDSTKLLRASTYGRGLWEFPLTPDFSISISNTPITIFAGQTPPLFNGAITALGGYSYRVNLSCTPASTCFVIPSFVNPPGPPPLGTPLTATVSPGNAPGDYSFDLHGAGTDPDRVTNDAAFTLKIVDFNLTAPSPASITVAPSSVSGPVLFQVMGEGSFDGTVNLSCGNLPSGATCNFLPSSSVNPTASSPVAITLTVSTSSNATAGTVPITIAGSVTNGPTKTQILSLTITLDYSLVITNPSLQAYVNSTVNFNGVLTSLNSYNSSVNLSCGQGAPPTCSAAPASVVPTASGAPFIVTAGSDVCGTYNFNIVAAGTDPLATSHQFPVTFTATSYTTPGFTLDVTPAAQTAPVNTAAIFNGTLQGTNCYNSPVNLSCGSGHPPSCTVSPSSLVPTVSPAPPAPFTVTVSTDVDQTYNFNVAAVGTDSNKTTHSFLAGFTSTGASGSHFSFTMTPNPAIESLPAGQPAVYDLDLTPSGGTFPNNVTLAYSNNCPPLSTCTLSSTQVNKGSGDTHVTFTITTVAPVIAVAHPARGLYALWLLLPGLIIFSGGVKRSGRQRRRFTLPWLLMLVVPVLWLEIACGSGLQGNGTGGNGQAGTPSGTYTMTVTATVSSVPQQSAQMQLTVN